MTLASDTAMVMAAGLGTRMKPLTNDRPKPLVQVGGKALIDYSLDALKRAGVTRAVVNMHYRADQLAAHLAARTAPAISLSDERALLMETGGGMVAALPLLPDPFFCLNSDNIWTDGAAGTVFDALSAAWDAQRMDALLLLVPHENAHNFIGKGDFDLDDNARVSRRSGEYAPYIYTGIQLVSHQLLRDAPEGPFSTNILWNRAIAEGRLAGIVHTGHWFEVGTPDAIAPTEEWLTKELMTRAR